jgi:hypothetical protein
MATKKIPKKKTEQAALFEPPPDLSRVEALAAELAATVAALPIRARVEALNRARLALHAVSPFAAEPVDCVLWVPEEAVEKNDWNPNTVAVPEMIALTHSVEKYGYTMPIVGSWLTVDPPRAGINDGFHRTLVPQRSPAVRARCHGYLPLSFLAGTMTEADRMSATELMNQARGTHSVVRELQIVQALEDAGWDAEQIAVGTVKSTEELVRIGQLAGGGAAANLASKRYAKSWDF